ncbi:Crp/Fnr family transcriptional regulator [Bradyrhizobium sp. PUT101]|uniref:Crp/Fnr family transcriptional regulator n=1 Tax=Bradyrhizobium sp. PUT101 TaxID=3447427 RepID=UPI003F87411E
MQKISKVESEKIASSSGWLVRVPSKFRADVLDHSVLIQLKKGEALFHVGDPPGGIYGLVAGTISVSLAPLDHAPRLMLLGIPGHWTGEACFLTRKPRRGEVRAALDTTLLHVPLDALDRMAAKDPTVSHHIAQILMMSVETLLEVVHDLQKPQADRRIASVLQRTIRIGEAPLPLTQSELGIMANASRKQVNAALKQFKEAGWLTHTYRAIIVNDVNALRRYADAERND